MYIIVENKPYFWDCHSNLIYKAQVKLGEIKVDFEQSEEAPENISCTYTRDELILFLSPKRESGESGLRIEIAKLKRENTLLKKAVSKL